MSLANVLRGAGIFWYICLPLDTCGSVWASVLVHFEHDKMQWAYDISMVDGNHGKWVQDDELLFDSSMVSGCFRYMSMRVDKN